MSNSLREPNGRCGMCGGDWSVCGCQGMVDRRATPPPAPSAAEPVACWWIEELGLGFKKKPHESYGAEPLYRASPVPKQARPVPAPLPAEPTDAPTSVLTEEDMEDLGNTHGYSGDWEEVAREVEALVLSKLGGAPYWVPSEFAPPVTTIDGRTWYRDDHPAASKNADDVKAAITNAIGFEWLEGELQTVNAADLLHLAEALQAQPAGKFKLGDLVTKTKGSSWTGRVVGTYSTALTPEGYAVESSTEHGSVQIYPASALAAIDAARAQEGEKP